MSATCGNQNLVSNPLITYTSPGSTGTLTLAPVTNAVGIGFITVTVNNGQPTNNLSTRSFQITVNRASTNASSSRSWTLCWQQTGSNMVGAWNKKGTTANRFTYLNPPTVDPSWKIAGHK